MILADSSVWIDFLGKALTPKVDQLDAMLGRERVVMGDLVLTEILQGYRSDREFEIIRKSLSALETISLITPSLAVKSARNYRSLRIHGITVRKTIDCLIATWCIENNVPLLYSDKDFNPFEKHLGLVTL